VSQHILVISPDPQITGQVSQFLGDRRIIVESAADTASGLAQANALPPNLIVLDAGLHADDGLETCRRLKSNPTTRALPVVLLLAHADQKSLALDAGAADYLLRPLDPIDTQTRLHNALRAARLDELLAARARIDGMTGLWNRQYCHLRLATELSAAQRNSRPLSLILMDVDHLQKINDQHGHRFGDEVLACLAQVLLQHCRTEDIVCRYGGDRFAVLTPGVGEVGAEALAERLWLTLSQQPLTLCGRTARLTCSFGIACTSAVGGGRLLEAAEQALSRAQRAGGNRMMRAEGGTAACGTTAPALHSS